MTSNKPHSFSSDDVPDTSLSNLKLLLVEDNEVTQILHRKFAEMWKISVEIAVNGEEVLRMLTRKQYDVVLMDLQMPVMDGYSACRQIRKFVDNTATIPVIGVSASTMPDIVNKAKEAGMNGFLRKPFTPDQLAEKIKEVTSD
jgi:CheY-like chemotaxis protein